MQSHDALLDEIAEEVHDLHHNLQSLDGLLDENSEERSITYNEKCVPDSHQNSVS